MKKGKSMRQKRELDDLVIRACGITLRGRKVARAMLVFADKAFPPLMTPGTSPWDIAVVVTRVMHSWSARREAKR